MDRRREIREFLASRRARVSPEKAGLPVFGPTRRTPGLRREELAMLANISPDYYARIERGAVTGVSPGVLHAIGEALGLDEVEREHLTNLTRRVDGAPRPARRKRSVAGQVRPAVQWTLDAITAPAAVQNARLDVLAANPLGRALFSPFLGTGPVLGNHARFMFLDPRAKDFYPEWERMSDDTVATLRAEAGRNPYDKALSDLVGELSTRSGEFRVRYAAHNVHAHKSGTKIIDHPVVGRLELPFTSLEVRADPGLQLYVYVAEPASASEDALHLLASWAATPTDITTTDTRKKDTT